MRPLSVFGTTLALAGSCYLFSCQKEMTSTEATIQSTIANKEGKTYPLHGKIDFYYQFIPGPGWVEHNIFPGYAPGGGEGELNYLGRSRVYFNQYTFLNFIDQKPVAQSRGEAVNMFYKDSLNFEIPDEVAMLFFDKQDNSIWGNFGNQYMTFTPINDTIVGLTAKLTIIGGTGKFAKAQGWYSVEGWFDRRIPASGYQTNASMVIKDGVLKF